MQDARTTSAPGARKRWRLTAALAAGAIAATGLVAAGAVAPAPAKAADCSTYPWMDTSKTADQRADALLAASTMGQKFRWLDEQSANTPSQTVWGSGASAVTYEAALPCTPTVVYTNGPVGVEGKTGVTGFPSPIGQAAAWDLNLAYAKGTAHAQEVFDTRGSEVQGPGISSARTPLNGRNSEYLGEDSLLAGLTAGAVTKGLQTGDPNKPVMATIKHYLGNEQETSRQSSSSNMDARTLNEVYDLPYAIASASGAPESTECAFNQINGVWACENPIMNTTLRAQDGYDGYIMSDFGAVHSTAPAIKAGLDQELNTPKFYAPAKLQAALDSGALTAADIDAAAFRVVRSYIRAGLFDHPLPATAATVARTDAHEAVAKQMVEEGSVLLKNDSVLPISNSVHTIAVIGQVASSTPTNGVSAKTVCSYGAGGSFGSGARMKCDALVDPLTAFTQRAAQNGQTVVYDNGADPAKAAAVAASADEAIVFGYYTEGEGKDRTSLNFDGNGDALVSAVAAANAKTVVVAETGSAVVMPWLNSVKGVVEAWEPGDQVGPGLASLLWGDVNFSGKLPMTFPKSLSDIPTSSTSQFPGIADANNILQVSYSEGLKVGYKWYESQNIAPLFPFGYGLSYSSFGYSDLAVKTSVASGKTVSTVSFTVTNTGSSAGSDVPQLYLTLPAATGEPGHRLVGFDRVQLGAGESKRETVVIDSAAANRPFSIWDTATGKWTVVDGRYSVGVGSSSQDLPLNAEIVVDHVAPTITSITLSQNQKIVVAATDDLSGVAKIEYSTQKNKQDASAWNVYTGPLQVDAKSTVSFRVTDNAGNVSDVVEVNRKDLR